MKTTVRKEELITILRDNLVTHEQAYREAVEGWKESVKESLSRLLEKVDSGTTKVSIHENIPESHASDYLRAIRMLELTTDEAVTLDDREADQLIMDEWDWSERWVTSNTRFSNTALELSASRGYTT